MPSPNPHADDEAVNLAAARRDADLLEWLGHHLACAAATADLKGRTGADLDHHARHLEARAKLRDAVAERLPATFEANREGHYIVRTAEGFTVSVIEEPSAE